MKIKYLTACLTNKYDYHKKIHLDPNDYDYIKDYYESIIKTNQEAIIITDGASDEFIKQYTTDKILFYKPKTEIHDNMQLHDSRFIYFKEYIEQDTETDYFVLTDVADVLVFNPIESIIKLECNMLYVGMEGESLNVNKWFDKKYYFDNENLHKNNGLKKYIWSHLNDYCTLFKNKRIINCGAICGHKHILLKLLSTMIEIMNILYDCTKIKYPVDMFIINYVIYKYFCENIYTGNKFTTTFFANEYDMTKCIKHK